MVPGQWKNRRGNDGRSSSLRLRRPNGYGPTALQKPKLLGGHGGKSFDPDCCATKRRLLIKETQETELGEELREELWRLGGGRLLEKYLEEEAEELERAAIR